MGRNRIFEESTIGLRPDAAEELFDLRFQLLCVRLCQHLQKQVNSRCQKCQQHLQKQVKSLMSKLSKNSSKCHLFALPFNIIVQSPLLHDMSSSKEIEFFVSDSFLNTQMHSSALSSNTHISLVCFLSTK